MRRTIQTNDRQPAPENRAGIAAAKAAIAQKNQGRPQGAPSGVSGPRANKGNQLDWFKEDAPGLKISPKIVVIMSLVFLAAVVGLHIVSKMRSGDVTSKGGL